MTFLALFTTHLGRTQYYTVRADSEKMARILAKRFENRVWRLEKVEERND